MWNARGGVFPYLYTLVISFFKLSVREELEVFFFDLYPTQTTTSLHTTKYASWEMGTLLAHEKDSLNQHSWDTWNQIPGPVYSMSHSQQMFTFRVDIEDLLSWFLGCLFLSTKSLHHCVQPQYLSLFWFCFYRYSTMFTHKRKLKKKELPWKIFFT